MRKIKTVLNKTKEFFKKRRKLIIVVLLLLTLGTTGYAAFLNKSSVKDVKEVTTSKITRGNLAITIEGSGPIEANERYDIVPLVKGTILSSNFEEGAQVNKDSILYEVDSSALDTNLQKAYNSIEKLEITKYNIEENVKNLKLFAISSGRVSGLKTKVGDNVSSNFKLCTITNTKNMIIKLPFSSADINNIHVGQEATVISSKYMSSMPGTVNKINYNPLSSNDGSLLYNVEIAFENPGSINIGDILAGKIGDMSSSKEGTIESINEEELSVKGSGEVKKLYISEGDYVTKGQLILELSNDTLQNQLKSNQIEMEDVKLSLQSQLDNYDDYKIKSPISGTVIAKNYKAGDTIDNTSASVKLMTIADLSKVKFVMQIDELDINKLKLEQNVTITTDALPNERFIGAITKISAEGTSTNGVTNYPVTVVIDQPGALRPGMNVDAVITIEEKNDVLMAPVSDVLTRGGRSYVVVKSSEDKAASKNNKSDDKTKTDVPNSEQTNIQASPGSGATGEGSTGQRFNRSSSGSGATGEGSTGQRFNRPSSGSGATGEGSAGQRFNRPSSGSGATGQKSTQATPSSGTAGEGANNQRFNRPSAGDESKNQNTSQPSPSSEATGDGSTGQRFNRPSSGSGATGEGSSGQRFNRPSPSSEATGDGSSGQNTSQLSPSSEATGDGSTVQNTSQPSPSSEATSDGSTGQNTSKPSPSSGTTVDGSTGQRYNRAASGSGATGQRYNQTTGGNGSAGQRSGTGRTRVPNSDGSQPANGSPQASGSPNGAPAGREVDLTALAKSFGVPEGYELKPVVTGIKNRTFIEIISGVNEGDEILSFAAKSTTNSFSQFRMGGGAGGVPGGMGGSTVRIPSGFVGSGGSSGGSSRSRTPATR